MKRVQQWMIVRSLHPVVMGMGRLLRPVALMLPAIMPTPFFLLPRKTSVQLRLTGPFRQQF